MTSKENIKLIPLTRPLKLGEGPHWDADKQLLLFVDMHNSQVHSYDPVTEEHCYAKVEGKIFICMLLNNKIIYILGNTYNLIKKLHNRVNICLIKHFFPVNI